MFRKLLSGLVGALPVVSLNGAAGAAELDIGARAPKAVRE